MSLTFTTTTSDDQLHQILALQKENLRGTKSIETESDQGFVTVSHDYNLLKDMNDACPHIIALDGDRVAGYALAMVKDFKYKIPILTPMFDLLDSLEYGGKHIKDYTYLVMGQVCVGENYRGQGVFAGMYQKYFETYKGPFDYIITEIAARNTRSMHAHMKVGFHEIYRYEESGMEEWVVVLY
jgi:Acetyltransferase (GNAT) family